jgi:hypothetical protein
MVMLLVRLVYFKYVTTSSKKPTRNGLQWYNVSMSKETGTLIITDGLQDDIFNDIAILARNPDDVKELMQQPGIPPRSAVEIITAFPAAPVLHQLTQVIEQQIRDVNNGDCYGRLSFSSETIPWGG